MESLAPLSVAVPLISAAILPALGLIVPRRVVEAVSVGVASAVAMMCSLLLIASTREPIVYWFGGWVPRDRIVPGIGFVVDPLGAGTATLVSVLVALSLLFSWRYFDAVKALFHTLMLVFMAGMVGLCLTGDLFNLFVFFEIMSVCGFALAGYQTEERGSLVGALNFAITNTIGAVMVLSGIALLYGRTGALNLALLGRALGEGPPDGLVTVAFILLAGGFLTKAAIVPFHFWLVDAYGTAVTPVCVIFAGVMSELGLFSLLRVYWTVFEGPLGPYAPELRAVLVIIGAVTAAVGGIMCLAQHHLSRLVAFAVVAHTGMFFVGIGLLDPASLGGAAIYVLTDGMVKAALFMGVGILFHRRQSLYDFRLHGRCRDLRNAGAIFALGGLALAGLPPFGTYLGKAVIEEAAKLLGFGWVTPLFVAASALTGAAVLKAGGRAFLGLGPEDAYDHLGAQEEDVPETVEARERTPATMVVPAALLLSATAVLGVLPAVPAAAETAAAETQDTAAYHALVLEGRVVAADHATHAKHTLGGVLYGMLSGLLAVGLAGVAIYRKRLPRGVQTLGRPLHAALRALRAAHSGRATDYVAWLTLGTALFGGLFVVVLR